MSAALRKPMTLPEFLAWEERQELRYEFDVFAPAAMTGGTIAHDRWAVFSCVGLRHNPTCVPR